ncbi:alpha/beta fold hydrolase [Sphingomonas sp. TDK1]|uniref:alpha/beta fold hydrolase n=1 Tax=Sphingomonas sp. TDK1 TaxID=453247 RepID=UPI0018DCE86A|nr:alpha/beta hydrolase [Sphingomonas sp. TDK1]
MARYLLAFIDVIGLPHIDLLGFSLGGFVVATGPRGGPNVHGWRKDIADAVRKDVPGAAELPHAFFEPTATSRAAGRDYLGRFLARTEHRDVAGSMQTRNVHYDAVGAWGVADHTKLQRLQSIRQPTFVANGDADAMIPPSPSHLMADLPPQAEVKIYPDVGNCFLFQHHAEFARGVNAFLSA